jgi:hypothetical protein
MLGVLGFPLYFLRNRGRALALICVVVLAVMEVSTVALLTGSLLGNAWLTLVAPLQYFDEVTASGAQVPAPIAAEIRGRPQTLLLLPMLSESVKVNTLLGPATANVFAVPASRMPWFVARIGERLVAGSLPRAGTDQIALPTEVLLSRHLHLGSVVGQEVTPEEWLPGRWTVVGQLGGTLAAGVAPYGSMRAFLPLADVPGVGSYAAFPRPGGAAALQSFLARLPLSQVRVYTEPAEQRQYTQDVRLLDWLVWCIDLVTVGVLSLAMGLLNNLYYRQRMEEYGVLAALGYTLGLLARRVLAEVGALTLCSWALGLGMTFVLVHILTLWVFGPQGITLPSLGTRELLFTTPIPALIAAFTLWTVLQRLWRLDPVAVVERRD